jgi:hypothetical protein
VNTLFENNGEEKSSESAEHNTYIRMVDDDIEIYGKTRTSAVTSLLFN